mmetsp:Transcript_15902/g.45511  ORF Transcript_15902/g.45511 Transcript_15902/m.45511 type:complete len:270 (-) Transcript_15902:818-1627(-)
MLLGQPGLVIRVILDLSLEVGRKQAKYISTNLSNNQCFAHHQLLAGTLDERRIVRLIPSSRDHRLNLGRHRQQLFRRLQQVDGLSHRRICHSRRHLERSTPHFLPGLGMNPPQRKIRRQHELQIIALDVLVIPVTVYLHKCGTHASVPTTKLVQLGPGHVPLFPQRRVNGPRNVRFSRDGNFLAPPLILPLTILDSASNPFFASLSVLELFPHVARLLLPLLRTPLQVREQILLIARDLLRHQSQLKIDDEHHCLLRTQHHVPLGRRAW